MLRRFQSGAVPRAPEKVLVEIAAHTVESATAAAAGGADRVELFSNPLEGGVTPSEGLILSVRKRISIDLHVLIRPRGGDFCYSEQDYEVMKHDISAVRRLGANGVALGALHPNGSVHSDRIRELVSLAAPMSVTFHRAFDMCRDLPTTLESLIACGVARVLSSGGRATALEGARALAELVRIAGERISIIAAGGIKPAMARDLVQKTGVREIHAGLRTTLRSPMQFRNEKVSFGPHSCEYERVTVNEADVRQLVEALASQ